MVQNVLLTLTPAATTCCVLQKLVFHPVAYSVAWRNKQGTHRLYEHHKKIKMSHSPIKYQFEMKVFFLFERNLPLFRWTDLKSLQQVLIFSHSRCICSIKREQLVARCHGKTLFPICYSHTEQKLQELEVNYDGESLGGGREGKRERATDKWRSVAGKVNFHCCSYCVVLQLVMNDRQRALSWRKVANGIVLHQPQDS